MITYNFVKYLFLYIKYYKILKNVYRDENFIENLSKTLNVEFKMDWVGRLYCIFNPNLVDVAERMLQKGTKLYLEGSLRTRKWQNQSGADVFTTEVVLNPFGGQMVILSGAKTMDGAGSEYTAATPSSAPREEISVADIGDEIPF